MYTMTDIYRTADPGARRLMCAANEAALANAIESDRIFMQRMLRSTPGTAEWKADRENDRRTAEHLKDFFAKYVAPVVR